MTVATLLGTAWAMVVVIAGCRHRPLPHRPLSRLRGSLHPGGSEGSGWVAVDALGRSVLELLRSHRPGSPAGRCSSARWAGSLALVVAASAVALPVLTPVVLLAGWGWPRLRDRRQQRRRLARLEADLPEVVDLLVLAVGAGANVSQAVSAAGRRGTGPLAGELARITREVSRGHRVADALDELPTRAGEAIRPLSAALTTCERYGAPLGPALERLGHEVRRQRRRRAEEAARKVPVVLLFPLVLCILPAFALLTVAPLVAGALRALRL